MTYADPSIGGGVKTWHPTFLYESLLNTVALVAILVSRRINKKQRLGDSICFYMTWYGLIRGIVIEPLRMDPLLFSQSIGPDVLFNRVNVVMNLVLALIGIIWFILKHTVIKSELYLEYQADIKSKKIDGVVCKLEGTLVLDSLMRASEFKSEKDTILLIKKPKIEKPKVEKKLQIDTVLPKEKVKIELVKKNINANRNGVAYAKTKLINLSNDDIEDLYVVISCDGNIIKKEKLTLLGNELEVKFELPAKFSTKTIKRNVLIKIEHKNELLIEKEYTITINRYKPSR
jgi:hypothetical protein